MLAAKHDGQIYLQLSPEEVNVLILALAYYLGRHRTPDAKCKDQARLLRRLSQIPTGGKGAQ